MPATEIISHAVQFTRFMSGCKSELLKVRDPIRVSGGDLYLAIQMLKSIMVREDNEVAMNQVVSPVSNRLNHCVKLDVVSAVSATRS